MALACMDKIMECLAVAGDFMGWHSGIWRWQLELAVSGEVMG
jgi:hypothetical protein